MSTTATHLLKKLDKLKERTAMHRADRKKDILLGNKSLFSEATNKKKFTTEEVEQFKIQYQEKLKQRSRKKRWVIALYIIAVIVATWLAVELVINSYDY